VIKPYLSAFERDWAYIDFLKTSQAPQRVAHESLELIWALCGPPSHSKTYIFDSVLDRIAAARPKVSVDRRFQWLKHRPFRR
jgi:hypothetical protein